MLRVSRHGGVSASGGRVFACLVGLLSGFIGYPNRASSSDIYWVGDQSDCPFQPADRASWFDGTFWYNFLPPDTGDTALFQTIFDPQGNGTSPHYIHLGDFRDCPGLPCNEQFLPADDASVFEVRVRDGIWIFDASSGGFRCSPTSSAAGSLTASYLRVGFGGIADATLKGGSFTFTNASLIGNEVGDGTLIVTDGAVVDSASIHVGTGNPQTSGTVMITGSGSSVSTANGDQGLGLGLGNQGTMTVTNEATASVGGHFFVGRGGSGLLSVTQGGSMALTTGELIIAAESPAASGRVVVDGNGSVLTNVASGIHVGKDYGGDGTLEIKNQGQVYCNWGFVGFAVENTGNVLVIGPSSVWTLTSFLTIGSGGTGTLRLAAGGRVVSPSITVGEHGKIIGVGSINGNIHSWGEFIPGASAGVLNIEGNLTVAPTGVMTLELSGDEPGNEYDQIIVSGNADVRGTLILQLVNGFVPEPGELYDVITASGGNVAFDMVTGQALNNGQVLALVPQGGTLSLLAADVTGLSIAPNATVVPDGLVTSFAATADVEGAPSQDVTGSATWSSDDPAIATVDSMGQVTGVAVGTTVIRAQFEGFEASGQIEVIPPAVVAALSRVPNCDLPIDMSGGLARTSDARQPGITRIVFAYSDSPADGVPLIEEATCGQGGTFGPYTGAATPTCSVAGNSLDCAFNPPLENARTYQLILGADIGTPGVVEIRGLIGDVNSDGRVNATDRSAVVGVWTGPNYSCDTDLDQSGRTHGTDRSIVVGAWTGGENCAP